MGPHSDDEMENESDQDFSDDEDYVDDISDADLMPDLLKQKPKGIHTIFNFSKKTCLSYNLS